MIDYENHESMKRYFKWVLEFQDNEYSEAADVKIGITERANMFRSSAKLMSKVKATRYKMIKNSCEVLKARKETELRRDLEEVTHND